MNQYKKKRLKVLGRMNRDKKKRLKVLGRINHNNKYRYPVTPLLVTPPWREGGAKLLTSSPFFRNFFFKKSA